MKTIITILIVAALGAGIYVYLESKKSAESEMVACTMDAKMCPDGSYVGRIRPKCEFQACPGASADVNVSI